MSYIWAAVPLGVAIPPTLTVYADWRVNDADAPLNEMPPMTTIVMPTLNEGRYIGGALDSLNAQNVMRAYPDQFEVLVVDSDSQDSTVDIAKAKGAKVVQSGRGKLTARNLGTSKAKGDVIAAVDGDTLYGSNYLNLTLRHFQHPEVVGVFSPRMHDHPVMRLYEGITIMGTPNRMWGSNDSFTKAAFLQTGGFDESIDQQDNDAMIEEEEYGFYDRLHSIGEVVYERWAPVRTSLRRFTHSDPAFDTQIKQKVRFTPERVF